MLLSLYVKAKIVMFYKTKLDPCRGHSQAESMLDMLSG
jgi:hypothetical protein